MRIAVTGVLEVIGDNNSLRKNDRSLAWEQSVNGDIYILGKNPAVAGVYEQAEREFIQRRADRRAERKAKGLPTEIREVRGETEATVMSDVWCEALFKRIAEFVERKGRKQLGD